jgi:putative membrane protein
MSALFRVGWSWEPSVGIGFGLWSAFYVLINWRKKSVPPSQQILFHFGTLTAFLALVSPLDRLGDIYLFSAHMVQHLLLMFVTAPLWAIGMPGWLIDRIIPRTMVGVVRRLANPALAFAVFIGVMVFWHIPVMYGLAQTNESIHVFEHLTFLGAALVGWWPVAGPPSSPIPKPDPPIRVLYLFLLAIPCSALSAILTFARAPLYPFYVTPFHPFGIDALQDLHLGGLFMWLPTHLILLIAMGITFVKWFGESDHKANLELPGSLSVE